jgi:stalled ribosome alternative rescue factor ArfA
MAAPKRNPAAAALATPAYRVRVVRPKKGKGSYSRKGGRA